MNSDFGYLDIILFAGVAVYLIYRLRSVLGQRHGEERAPFDGRDPFNMANGNQPPNAAADPTAGLGVGPGVAASPQPGPVPGVVPGPVIDAAPFDVARTGLVAGIEAIASRDQNFRAGEFLSGARSAFVMIVKAFADGDLPTLQSLLSDRLYQIFAGAVAERKSHGLTAETIVERILSAEIVGAKIVGDDGHVTVRFETEQTKILRNADGAVVEGDPDRLVRVEDVWTFARMLGNPNPNWQLIQTGVTA